jgi:hypothetical protein
VPISIHDRLQMNKLFYIQILWFLLVSMLGSSQSINTEFGKNRVQFHDDFDDRWMYETENFITYWYGKSKQVAIPAMQMAEIDHDNIQKVLEHRMNDKIEMIVYTDLSDLKQSNIGTEETFASKGGETKIVGNKMFIYFDGDHNHMRTKIKEGISSVYFSNMLYGSTLQEILQNAVLLNLPEWYKKGIVSYAAAPWNQKIESELREVWQSNPKIKKFDKLEQLFPRHAGHALWYYIDQNYGRSSISNIIYLTKINRGINNSFEYTLNKEIEELKKECMQFYKDYFNNEVDKFTPFSDDSKLKLKNSKKNNVTKLVSSPDGKLLAYSYNYKGKYRIALYEIESKKHKVIFKYGYNNHFQETDFNYPLISWHPDGHELSYIYEHKDVIKLVKYDVKSGDKAQQLIPTAFQRIYSFDYVNDLDYIFSANVDGYSDLHYYKSKNRNHGNITKDQYDDVDASYVTYAGSKGILFSSNRTNDSIQSKYMDTILPIGTFDLYFLADGAESVTKITQTPDISERQARMTKKNKLFFLSDMSGINNLYEWDFDQQIYVPKTNVDRNIETYDIAIDDHFFTTQFRQKKNLINRNILDSSTPRIATTKSILDTKSEVVNTPNNATNSAPSEWKQEYEFQTIYDDLSTHQAIESAPIPVIPLSVHVSPNLVSPSFVLSKPIERYNNSRAVAANKRFGFSNIVTKLDNDILFEGLESYTGDRPDILNAPLGILFRSTVKDLFEDYTVDAGIRVPTSFNGSETFLIFDNKKSRIDKRYVLYRKTNAYNTSVPGANFATRSQKTSILGMYQLKYPFHIYSSIRATSSLRFDRFHQLSTENLSFEAPVSTEKRLGLKLEYIYDNTFDAAMNIKHGLRLKVFNEAINQFDINFIDGVKFDLSNGFTNVLGYDARYYLPILRRSVLAFRSAAATSFGNKKMLYYLGGVENNILRKFDNSIPLPEQGDFAYKVNAYHLRGFNTNIRNGSTFFVNNLELRIPVMQYILGTTKGNAFFRNMQLTGFFDAGVAFYGANPFSEKNILNKITIESPPLINLEVEYFRDPLVLGVGYGVRTQILGYFLKVDYGYGIETRKIQKPVLAVSLGLDF